MYNGFFIFSEGNISDDNGGTWMSKFKKILILIISILTLITITSCDINKEVVSPKVVSYIGLGAQETVGGSMHLLKVGKDNYLIDAGIFYGDEGANYPLPKEIEIDKLSAVFITHAHADHVGRLPLLLENGYKGPIYMTSVTKDILEISLISGINYADFGNESFYYTKNNKSDKKPVYLERFDYGKYEVKEENRIYINSKREDLDEMDCYLASSTKDNLEKELKNRLDNQILTSDYDQLIKINEALSFEFIYTSHLPGSSIVKLNVLDKSIIFSGDIGSDNSPFLAHNSKIKEKIDFLFVEGTYGNKESQYNNNTERENYQNYIGNAIKNNERVIIPAFAIDRTQQVLYEIKNGIDQGIIPKNTTIKVYSPTSEKITDLYKHYSDNEERYKDYFTPTMFTDIFNIPNLIHNPRNSNNLYDLNVAYGEIGVMTSGMISSGFSEEITKEYIEDENTNFIFVSYQDPGEIGGQIKKGDMQIIMNNKKYNVNAQIYEFQSFGGHGDLKMIFKVFEETSPEKIFLVHLNNEDGIDLKNAYMDKFSKAKIILPKFKEEHILFTY